jgi:hypothetical protein
MESSFDEFEKSSIGIKRRELLPWWMKVFCWLFMIFAGVAVFSLTTFLAGELPFISFYGFDGSVSILDFLIIFPVVLLHGLTGYYLWFEKDEAILLSRLCGIVGILACIASMFVTTTNGNFTFRFEIIFLAVFLKRISIIQDEWKYSRKLSV